MSEAPELNARKILLRAALRIVFGSIGIGTGIILVFILLLNVVGVKSVVSIATLISYLVLSFFIAFVFIRSARMITSPVRKNASLISGPELQQKVLHCFREVDKDVENPFEIFEERGYAQIRWSGKMLANQLTAANYSSINACVQLTFLDQERTVIMRVVKKSIRAGIDSGGIQASGTYTSGFSISFSSEMAPSLEVENGIPVIKVKSLQFNTMEIQEPAAYTILSNGWNIRLALL